MSEELKDIDTDWESEKLCRWAAARAGVIVIAPVLGSMALIANEVYMITRLAELRGVKLSEGAIMGLLGSLGATFVGQTLVTLIPVAPIQVPVAISVTYGVGKAASAWIKAGRPEDVASFKEVYEKARKEGMDNVDSFKNMDCKDEPLGDESKKFSVEDLKNIKPTEVFGKVMDKADKAESIISSTLHDLNERFVNPLKTKSNRWISAQNWEQLSKGELVIPYEEIKKYLATHMSGSDFALLDIGFGDPDKMALSLQHKDYGTINLQLSIIDFFVDQKEASTHLKVEAFDIEDNDFAGLVIQTVGDKLILAILDLAFDNVEIEEKGIKTTYADRVISVDFEQMLKESKLSQAKFLEKSVLDVLHLVSLAPLSDGLKIKASVAL